MQAFDFEPEYRRRIRKKIEEKQQKADIPLQVGQVHEMFWT